MAQGINLLKPEKQTDVQLVELAHKVKVGSLLFLIFYCLSALATFSFSVYLRQASEKNAREIEGKKSKISELRKIESQQLTLKQRLAALTELTSKKGVSEDECLSQLEETLESGVTIKEIDLGESGTLKVNGKAQQAVVLARFFEKLTQKTIFSKIVISSLSRQKDGTYLFNLDLKTS